MAKLTLDQGRFRLDRLTRALGWVLPLAGVMLAVVLLGESLLNAMARFPEIMGLFTLVALIVVLVAVTLSCMWLYRANANLHAVGVQMNHGPTMAWLWTFVPIATLFKPYQVTRELWTDSLRETDSFAAPATPLLGQWWAAWLIGTISLNASGNALFAQTPVGQQVMPSVAALALLAASFLFRAIVRRVNQGQQGLVDADVFA